MNDENDVKGKIIKALKKNPHGLHIMEIARLTGTHRNTVTKYIYELRALDIISERQIGSAKVYILTAKGERLS